MRNIVNETDKYKSLINQIESLNNTSFLSLDNQSATDEYGNICGINIVFRYTEDIKENSMFVNGYRVDNLIVSEAINKTKSLIKENNNSLEIDFYILSKNSSVIINMALTDDYIEKLISNI